MVLLDNVRSVNVRSLKLRALPLVSYICPLVVRLLRNYFDARHFGAFSIMEEQFGSWRVNLGPVSLLWVLHECLCRC